MFHKYLLCLQTQKTYERAEADLKNVQNILHSIGISDIDDETGTEGLLERVQSNINMLHRKSEELTSRNLSVKVEIDKLRSNMDLSEVCRAISINYFYKIYRLLC